MRERVGVIGAGIIGLAVARRLTGPADGAEVTVLEKEGRVGSHQTSHNSGVVHAGLYYAQGSLKARLCRRGGMLLRAYCEERGIAFEECGKVVVAVDRAEIPRLAAIERQAEANGVPGLRRLHPAALEEIEPHVRGIEALHSPHTAITDFASVAAAFAEDVSGRGGNVRLGFEVVGIRRAGAEMRVLAARGEELAFDRLIVCGGLHADRLAMLAGERAEPAIIPFRGEYHRLRPERSGLVRGLIYPVPDPAYPFLGVHFTRRVDGHVDVGPNAVLALAREGYRRGRVAPFDVVEMLRYAGFRGLARRHWRMGLEELLGSLSSRAFVARARRFIPELRTADVERAPAGVRAQAVDPDGSLVDDFRITRAPGLVLVRNAPSPAATSALAIAEHILPG